MPDLETIYLEYKDKVFGYLINKVGNPTVAEDICSDVFLKVASSIEGYDSEKASISTWIYSITTHTLYDYYRTRHETGELDCDIPDEGDISDGICREEMLEALADALEALAEREREIIIRRYYYGERLNSIADTMGISYSYAKVLHKSALKKTGKILKNSGLYSE